MIKNLWEKFVVWRYIKSGLCMGDMHSYSYMGESVGPDWDKIHAKWKARYIKLGYHPLTNEQWQLAGGYGEEYKTYIRIKARHP
jgi:hypothetical protein